MVRGDGDARREDVVEDPVVAHVAGRQDEVADLLVVPEARAVADHEDGVGAEDGDVVGDRLGVRRADADVDEGQACGAGELVVPRRHLDAASGADGARVAGAERLGVHLVVREEDVPLEALRRRAGVVLEAVEGEVDPLGAEEEELLLAEVPGVLVEALEEGGVVERDAGPRAADGDARAVRGELAELALEVPADGAGPGELSPQDRVVARPGAVDLELRVETLVPGGLDGVAEARGRAPRVRCPGEAQRSRRRCP